MESRNKQILKILYVLSWVIFIGLCIEAGGFIFSAFYTLCINASNAAYFWELNDLSALYKFDHGHFFAETMLISIAGVLRACMFYGIIKILHDKKLNLVQPFSKDVERLIFRIAYLSLLVGLFSWSGVGYTEWLVKQNISMPDTQHLRLGGADVWIFMGVTLFVVGQIFKRGIAIQTENELTV